MHILIGMSRLSLIIARPHNLADIYKVRPSVHNDILSKLSRVDLESVNT